MPDHRRARRLLLAAAVLALVCPTLAEATPPARDAVRALERGAQRVARLRRAEPRAFSALGSIEVRPGLGRGVIIAGGRGYFLDRRGELSAADRAELGGIVARTAPGATGADVHRTLRASIHRERLYQRELRTADPTIAGLLDQVQRIAAKPAAGTQGGAASGDVLLWSGRRASLIYRPLQKVIAGREGLFGTGRGFFLERGKQGALTLRDDSRQDLRRFVKRHRVTAGR